MSVEAFLTLHQDLEREGPGEPADIEWLGQQISLPDGALIADLACGPGADIGPLLDLAGDASLVAIDHNPHFLEQASAKWEGDARVDMRLADMREPGGRFDLIWCAGAVYFLGVTEALEMWKSSLNAGGVIAFSEPCFWADTPSKSVAGIWEQYPAMSNEAGINARVEQAGYETIATRRLSDDAWSAFYTPMLERIAVLSEEADDDMRMVLADAVAEIAAWDKYGDEFGYLLSVVRPK